jgi:hypothetical protein
VPNVLRVRSIRSGGVLCLVLGGKVLRSAKTLLQLAKAGRVFERLRFFGTYRAVIWVFPRIKIVLGVEGAEALDVSTLTLSARVEDGERTRVLDRTDFTSENGRRYSAGLFRTATSGTARVSCILSGAGAAGSGRAVTKAAVNLALRGDFRYRVDCVVAEENPYPDCLGCFGSEAASLAPGLGLSPSDSLFVLWGSNSIGDPVDY